MSIFKQLKLLLYVLDYNVALSSKRCLHNGVFISKIFVLVLFINYVANAFTTLRRRSLKGAIVRSGKYHFSVFNFRLTGQISKLEQLDMQARCYLNIGVVKEHMEDFEESIANMEKALKISKSNDIFELTHTCYVSMSLLYHCKKNDPTSALRFCNLALEAAKRLQQKVKKICETLIIKSEILVKAGDFASAKQILTKAYKKNTPDENDRQAIEKSLRIGKLISLI